MAAVTFPPSRNSRMTSRSSLFVFASKKTTFWLLRSEARRTLMTWLRGPSRRGALRSADDDEDRLRGQYALALRPRPASGDIEHQVEAPATPCEVLARVVDDVVGPPSESASSTFFVLHTPVTSAPNAFAICTANVPTPPDAPLMRTFCPSWSYGVPVIPYQSAGFTEAAWTRTSTPSSSSSGFAT